MRRAANRGAAAVLAETARRELEAWAAFLYSAVPAGPFGPPVPQQPCLRGAEGVLGRRAARPAGGGSPHRRPLVDGCCRLAVAHHELCGARGAPRAWAQASDSAPVMRSPLAEGGAACRATLPVLRTGAARAGASTLLARAGHRLLASCHECSLPNAASAWLFCSTSTGSRQQNFLRPSNISGAQLVWFDGLCVVGTRWLAARASDSSITADLATSTRRQAVVRRWSRRSRAALRRPVLVAQPRSEPMRFLAVSTGSATAACHVSRDSRVVA